MRLLLIQARNTADIEAQEQRCFLSRCRLAPEQLVLRNVVRDPLKVSDLDSADVMMIGGSGEYSAWKDYPWMGDLLNLVREADRRSYPTFGSCWGHQIIARALGGRVEYAPDLLEMGCLTIDLTDEGTQDELFAHLPRSFKANVGHHDRVTVLPEGAVELATTASQGHQAFRIAGKPIYGTQFHSELDAEAEQERLLAYRPYYTEVETDKEFQAILDTLAPTPEVDGLLAQFLKRFVRAA
ncbi:MAG: type 1 glutamine amidotransferase [Rhodothermales bacterium]